MTDFETPPSKIRTAYFHDHTADDVNKLIMASLRAEYTNTETLVATKELADVDYPYQVITASGADQTVELAPEAITNHITVVRNGGASNNVAVTDDSGATTFATLAPGQAAMFLPLDGVGWIMITIGATSGAVPHAPGGRPTLVTGVPWMTTEQAAKTTVYYTPCIHDLYPSWDGSVWTERNVSELSIALDSNAAHTGYHQSGKLFDLYVVNDAGTDRLCTGVAWASDTSRGTGAGTAECERMDGVWTNKYSMTMRFGTGAGDTLTVPANQGTRVGCIRASANGTTTWELGGAGAGGDEIRLYLWSDYNRFLAGASSRDDADSWTNNSATWGALDAGAANSGLGNRASFIVGEAVESIVAISLQRTTNPAGDVAVAGIGLDATNANSAQVNTPGIVNVTTNNEATYQGVPGIGYHFLQAIERAANGGGATYTGLGDGGTTYYQMGLKFLGWF